MSGEDIVPYEYVLLDKKGHKVEAIITTKLIDYADGKAILGIITDITERKRVEKELQYRLKFQHLITTVSSQFVNLHPAQIDDEIDDALPKIAELPMRTAVMFSNSPMTKNPYPAPMNGVLRESRQPLSVFKMRRWTHIHGR